MSDPDLDAVTITVTDHDAKVHTISVPTDFPLMQGLIEHLPLKAECGGACACATCHVYLADPSLFSAPSEDEIDMLDMAFSVNTNSRLSCQLMISPAHAGMVVTLAPGTEKD